MNRDDIIRMALEVGFVAYGEDGGEYRIPTPAFYSRLERFAALVAEAERKRLEATAWGASQKWIERAIEAEREACAMEADYEAARWPYAPECREPCEEIAKAIRARDER